MWEKSLKKHIDILDYDIFKNHQIGINALKTFVIMSINIHIEYLILESNRKNPDYTFTVLNCIKELDNIMIDNTFLVASHLQYANQLDLKEEHKKLINRA